MEKYVSKYELALILKNLDGENGYSKLADIVMGIQEEFGDVPELGGYGWWPLQDDEDTYYDCDGKEVTEVVYAYQNYAELSTKVAIDLVSSLYGFESNKIFMDLNEEAIEILEEIRKDHGPKRRWRTIGKAMARRKKYVHKIELEEA